jgi:hypothetical protein
MTTPTVKLTRARRVLLVAVEAGYVRRERHYPYGSHRVDKRSTVTAALEPLRNAGLVALDHEGAGAWSIPWKLTDAGRDALAAGGTA